jgi:hypothetical protein
MTDHEKLQIGIRALALRDEGKIEEARALEKTMPMPPWAAEVFKKRMGLDFLLGMGWNMEDVVAKHGQEWLKK